MLAVDCDCMLSGKLMGEEKIFHFNSLFSKYVSCYICNFIKPWKDIHSLLNTNIIVGNIFILWFHGYFQKFLWKYLSPGFGQL